MAALHDLLHPEIPDPDFGNQGWEDQPPPPAAPPDEPPPPGPAAGGLTAGGAVFGLGSATGRKPLIELVVPYDVVLGGSTPGLAGGYGPIPADVLRDLLAQAAAAPSDWCLTVVGDNGRVVKHVRTQHDPTVAQARFVRARDRRCTFPGCQRTADRCDLDHRRAWEKGGPTCPCNLHPLCRHHHRVKQADGWQVERDPHTGLTRWSTPHGLTATNDTDNPDPWLYETGRPPGDTDPPGDPPERAA